MIAGSDTGNGCARSLTVTTFRLLQPGHQRPPGRVGQRRKNAVEAIVSIVNH